MWRCRHESGLGSSFEEKLTLDDIQTDAIKLNAVGRNIENTEPVYQELLNKGEKCLHFRETERHETRQEVGVWQGADEH